MAHGSNPQLVITTIWDFNTDTVRMLPYGLSMRELNVPVSEEKRGVGAEAGVGISPMQVDSKLIRTRAPGSQKGTGDCPRAWYVATVRTGMQVHLGPEFERHKARLSEWHDNHLGSLESPGISGFMAELEESVSGTPRSRQRRAVTVRSCR